MSTRDNSKRIPENIEVPEPKIGQNKKVLLSDISMMMPTESVILPSKGIYYDKSSSLYGKTELEIKSLTAKEEDILSSSEYMQKGNIFDKLIESVLIDKTINSKELLIGDRNAILLAARISGYGPEYSISKRCENCNKVADHTFDLSISKPKDVDLESLGVTYADNLFWFELPKTKIEVAIKPLSAFDKDQLDKQRNKKTKLGLESSDLIDFLQAIIVEAGGSRNRGKINEFVEIMPAIDSRKIRTLYKEITPDIDTKQTICCSACSWESESEVWFGLNFFWPEL